MSDANEVLLRICPEGTFKVPPIDSTWQHIRFTSESLTGNPQFTTSNEVRQDRMLSDQIKVGFEVLGGVDFEFSNMNFDMFLEGAIGSGWEIVSNPENPVEDIFRLRVGKTFGYSYSLEKEFYDLPNTFLLFSGMCIGEFNLTISPQEIINGSVTFLGAGYSTKTTSQVGSGSTDLNSEFYTNLPAAGSNEIIIKIDGTEVNFCVEELSFSIDNSLRATNCIGEEFATGINASSCKVTGNIKAFLSRSAFLLYEKALSNTQASLEFKVNTGGNSFYTFVLPKIKLSGDTPQASGLDTNVLVELEYTAVYDPVEQTNLLVYSNYK